MHGSTIPGQNPPPGQAALFFLSDGRPIHIEIPEGNREHYQ